MAVSHAMRKERAISRRLLLAAIGEKGATKMEILAASGLHHSTFGRVLKELREEKIVHIGDWLPRTHEISGERLPGTQFAVYMLGDKKDAKRKKWLPKSEVQAKYQASKRVVTRAKVLAQSGKSNMFDQLRYAA